MNTYIADNSKAEGKRLFDEATNLEPFKIGDATIHLDGFPSLTDGKSKKIWSEGKGFTSCYGCGATYKELAEKDHPKFKTLKDKARSLCFANCHLKTNAFKWLMKGCTYRGFEKYAVETDEDKLSQKIHEMQLIDDFRVKHPLKLKVTKTMLGNVGPTVKDAFKYPEAMATIMFCPVDLVQDLVVIFKALDCGLQIDAQKFKAFTANWLERFHKSDYSWNQLSPTVHFVMYHGWQVKYQLDYIFQKSYFSVPLSN